MDEKIINSDESADIEIKNSLETEEATEQSIEPHEEINSASISPSGVQDEEKEPIADGEPDTEENVADADNSPVEYEQEDFNFYPTEEDIEDYQEDTEDSLEEEEEEEEEEILSPDELFKDRYVEQKRTEESDSSDNSGKIVEEDGQYRLTYEVDEEAEDTSEDDEDEETEIEEDEEQAPKYNQKKPRGIDSRFDFVELFIFTLLAVMIITSFFFRHSIVDGESMEGTLHSGEHLIISDFLYTPKRGDIVVCEDYTTPIKKPIVKRVIAIEGDTVRITENGEVYVNDKLLDESAYVYIDDAHYTHEPLYAEVQKGEIFVMGDHRNQSTDSRNEAVGTLSVDSVIGKVLLRFYPLSKFGTVK